MSEVPNKSSNPKLRTVEPFHSSDGVEAEVYFGSIGRPSIVVIAANTAKGDPAEVTLDARECHDLMLWLQCALSAEPPAVETSERDGPSTCAYEGHDWKIKCMDCGETHDIPHIHLSKGGKNPDALLYSARDVEAMVAVGTALAAHRANAQKQDTRPVCPQCGQINGFHRESCPLRSAVKATRELTLKDFGYAPGNYTFKCLDCGQESIGDKRAARCETCATQAMRENRVAVNGTTDSGKP